MRRIGLARVLMKLSDVLPRKYPLYAASELTRQPFFVFGSGRNGSTLLNRMLNQHSELFLPSEQYFLGESVVKFKLYNFLVWRDLVKILIGELNPEAQKHTWKYGGEDLIQKFFNDDERALDALMDDVFRGYAAHLDQHPKIWGDTTPPNIHFVPEILSLFPKAKFFFLIRDGRDVVASHKRAGEEYLGPMSLPENAADLWNKSVRMYDWLKKRVNVQLLRYEDLVTNTEETLNSVCENLEVDFEPSMRSAQREVPEIEAYREPIHENIGKAVFDTSIGKYQEVLSEAEMEVVVKKMEVNLNKMGYS